MKIQTTWRSGLVTTCAAMGLGLWIAVPALPTAAQTGGPPPHFAADAAEPSFMVQLLAQHAVAVRLSQPLAADSQHPELAALATTIGTARTEEITQLRAWLKAWYGVDTPDPLAAPPATALANPAGDGSAAATLASSPRGQLRFESARAASVTPTPCAPPAGGWPAPPANRRPGSRARVANSRPASRRRRAANSPARGPVGSSRPASPRRARASSRWGHRRAASPGSFPAVAAGRRRRPSHPSPRPPHLWPCRPRPQHRSPGWPFRQHPSPAWRHLAR